MNNAPVLTSVLRRWVAGLVILVVLLTLLVIFFPWNLLREPINRYVTDQLGRRFEITKQLSVNLGRTATVRADGIELANPDWARDPFLVKASAAEFEIKLWPLLFGEVEIPRLSLFDPEIGLQIEPDGRRTWSLSRDTSDTRAVPNIGALTVDKGTLRYLATKQGADVTALFSLAPEASGKMPLSYKASGKWRNEAFTASGRTGGVLQLSKDFEESFPIEVNAQSGRTILKATGSIANLAKFAGLDAAFDIQGRNLDELYKLVGVVLPATPPYKLRGKLSKRGEVWAASQIQGVLGSSDINGALNFDTSGQVAMLTGKVQSKLLDFADLKPVIGLPAGAIKKSGATATALISSEVRPVKQANAGRKVLPIAMLDLARLKAMNADVTYSAADIRHVEQLPLAYGKDELAEPIPIGGTAHSQMSL